MRRSPDQLFHFHNFLSHFWLWFIQMFSRRGTDTWLFRKEGCYLLRNAAAEGRNLAVVQKIEFTSRPRPAPLFMIRSAGNHRVVWNTVPSCMYVLMLYT